MIKITTPGIDKRIKQLEKREALFNSYPQEVTDKTKSLVQGPKLWQADTEAEEMELAQFEKDNKLAMNAIKAFEDALTSIMRP